MKAAPRVDVNGLMTGDVIVADTVKGVFPQYVTKEPTEEGQEAMQELTGYIVAVAVPPGLYLPKFDVEAWKADPKLSQDKYWIEGLTQEQIDELLKPQPGPVTVDQRVTQVQDQTLTALSGVADVFEQLLDMQAQIDALKGGTT